MAYRGDVHPPVPVHTRRARGRWMAAAVLAACAPGAAAAQPRAVTAEWAALDSILQSSFPADGPGAAAVVVRDGQVLYRGAAGMADLEMGVAMRPEMVFPVFSVTKQFTGAAILLLAQEGRLSLSDPVSRHLPDFPLQGRTVTVEQLLAHTSGLTSYTDLPEWMPTLRSHTTGPELIAQFRDEPFRFEPGTAWAYNNSGYVLLGAIIERLSGMSYGDFVRSRILVPLGMSSSRIYDAPDAIIPRMVEGYSRGPGDGWMNAEYYSLTNGYAVGNLVSSVDDLARWNTAMDRGEVLTPASWQRAFTSFRLNDGTEARYGAGWFVGTLGSLATAEHSGDLVGGKVHVLRVPERRLFVAVLANSDPAPADPERLATVLAARVLGISPDPAEAALAPAALDAYAGVYRVGQEGRRTISREGDRLFSRREGGDRLELYPIGEDRFAIRSVTGLQMHFVRENGRVVAMRMVPRLGLPGALDPRVD